MSEVVQCNVKLNTEIKSVWCSKATLLGVIGARTLWGQIPGQASYSHCFILKKNEKSECLVSGALVQAVT